MDPGALRNPKMITQPKMAGSFSETRNIQYMGRIQSSVLHLGIGAVEYIPAEGVLNTCVQNIHAE